MRILAMLAIALTATLASAQTTLNMMPPAADIAAPPKDAYKTRSTLATKVITAGDVKAHPRAMDRVTVHYTGWTTDGKMFDSAVARGEPTTFPLDRVIAGCTEECG